MAYERHYGAEARVEYVDMTARLVVGDDISHFDRSRAQRVCGLRACVAYHIFCDNDAGHERCLVLVERGHVGVVDLEVISRGERLPTDWAERFAVLPIGATQPISFSRMHVSDNREWPEESRGRSHR